MGGRGASSGMSDSGKKYGTEYRTILQVGNVKFIKKNDGKSIKEPLETMSKNRVYVTIGRNDIPKSVTFYDKENKRYKQIDINGRPHKIDGKYVLPHTHYGYLHNKGTTVLTEKDTRRVERLVRYWYNHTSKE